MRNLILALAALAVVVFLWFAFSDSSTSRPLRRSRTSPSTSDAMQQAREAVKSQAWASAERDALTVLADEPQLAEAILIAGASAIQQKRIDEGVARLLTIPDDSRLLSGELLAIAKWLLEEQKLSAPAERVLRKSLATDAHNVAACKELADLLAVQGRRQEAIPWILELFRQGQVSIDHVALLGMSLGVMNNSTLLRDCHLADRSDPAILAGLAASTTLPLTSAQKRILLEEAVRSKPELLEAQTRLGDLLLESGDDKAVTAWLSRLPEAANDFAPLWSLRGKWAMRLKKPDVAARCFWEAVKLDPNDRVALYQLSQWLQRDGGENATAIATLNQRSAALEELRELTDVLLHTEQESLAPMESVARKLSELGRSWEAWGWCQAALQLDPQASWARQLAAQMQAQLGEETTLTAASVKPDIGVDLSDVPVPPLGAAQLAKGDSSKSQGNSGNDAPPTTVKFQDDAARTGLVFTYFNSPRPTASGKQMYEFPGGGLGVLDLDADGWPDVYCTQGASWPPGEPGQARRIDRVFRNVLGAGFQDVTTLARIEEPNFSHGVSVGDFDHDGFDDVFVANIGANRLFHNNGDGTFSDVTDSIQGQHEQWTTNTVMADLDGDGWVDLLEVNYAEADDVFERICKHADGTPRMCMPFHFPPAQDRVYRGVGNGQFEDATSAAGFDGALGRGLGVVVGNLVGNGKPAVLVANDVSQNFLFEAGDKEPWFREQGVLAGVAYNGEGRVEGCMGVAAGDVDENGYLDFFIGNFLRETNTLYLQEAPGQFVDATRAAGLSQPSVDMLAFGTQFLDIECDGDLDLMIANGHVDDVRKYGRQYHMQPQVFENAGGKFTDISARAGDYFHKKHLGRSLALLDWNGDGRQDAVVSHLDSPVALLTNRSSRNRVVVLRLVGLESARMPIGVTVSGTCGGRRLVRQLTAGNGYQCSNQRCLVFGLGKQDQLSDVAVRWPRGTVQQLGVLTADREYLIVEHADEALPADIVLRD